MIVERTLKNFQVKALFEYFNGLVNKEGQKPVFSDFVFQNFSLLGPAYAQLMNEINKQDPAIAEYSQKANAIMAKYAERDEKGMVKAGANGQPVITDPAKYSEEMEELNKASEGVQEKFAAESKAKNELMQKDVKVNIFAITLSEFIDTCPPFVVGLTKI